MDLVVSELGYKGKILQSSFFVKFYGKKFGSHNMTRLYSNLL